MSITAEVAAYPCNVPHAQRPLGGAAQMGRAQPMAFQERVVDHLLEEDEATAGAQHVRAISGTAVCMLR